MSSLRNAVKRITHKERGQVQKRSHLGMLEKKQDYKKRSDHYHRREDRVKAMQQRASMRNPDEFYFGMHKAQVIDGHHKKTVAARQEEFDSEIGNDTLRLMKDQDLQYIRLQKQKDMKKIEKLQSSLHYLDPSNSKKRKHTIFVNSQEEAENFDPVKHFDTAPEFIDRAFNRPRIDTLKKTAMQRIGLEDDDNELDNNTEEAEIVPKATVTELEKQAKVARKVSRKIARARNSAYGEMEERKKRVETLKKSELHLMTEKWVSSKGRKRKIAPAANGKPAVYQWRRKRLS